MGKSNRSHHRKTVHWAIVVGVITSALIATALYYSQKP